MALIKESYWWSINISNIHSAYIVTDNSSPLLEQLLTACHFGHYIKVIAQDKIGSLVNESECEAVIAKWLNRHTSKQNSPQSRSHYPLKSFNIKIKPVSGKVGAYNCQILLEPHMTFEHLTAKILLNSEIIMPSLI